MLLGDRINLTASWKASNGIFCEYPVTLTNLFPYLEHAHRIDYIYNTLDRLFNLHTVSIGANSTFL